MYIKGNTLKFDKWMHSTSLSESSVKKYYGAISGALSKWANDAGLIQINILEITSTSKFDELVININKLPIYQERNATGNKMYSNALNKYASYLKLVVVKSIEEDIEDILSESLNNVTEKSQLISARVGQGQFRKSLLTYWGKCAVTGYKNPSMLLASHIKPWSRCSNIERLDKFNGLLLTPNLDRAFDQGLISFEQSGAIILSKKIVNVRELGISNNMKLQLDKEHQPYMDFHRTNVFKGT